MEFAAFKVNCFSARSADSTTGNRGRSRWKGEDLAVFRALEALVAKPRPEPS